MMFTSKVITYSKMEQNWSGCQTGMKWVVLMRMELFLVPLITLLQDVGVKMPLLQLVHIFVKRMTNKYVGMVHGFFSIYLGIDYR